MNGWALNSIVLIFLAVNRSTKMPYISVQRHSYASLWFAWVRVAAWIRVTEIGPQKNYGGAENVGWILNNHEETQKVTDGVTADVCCETTPQDRHDRLKWNSCTRELNLGSRPPMCISDPIKVESGQPHVCEQRVLSSLFRGMSFKCFVLFVYSECFFLCVILSIPFLTMTGRVTSSILLSNSGSSTWVDAEFVQWAHSLTWPVLCWTRFVSDQIQLTFSRKWRNSITVADSGKWICATWTKAGPERTVEVKPRNDVAITFGWAPKKHVYVSKYTSRGCLSRGRIQILVMDTIQGPSDQSGDVSTHPAP